MKSTRCKWRLVWLIIYWQNFESIRWRTHGMYWLNVDNVNENVNKILNLQLFEFMWNLIFLSFSLARFSNAGKFSSFFSPFFNFSHSLSSIFFLTHKKNVFSFNWRSEKKIKMLLKKCRLNSKNSIWIVTHVVAHKNCKIER